MKRINIYLTEQEKKKLAEISKKYKVSLSTIADKVCWITYTCLYKSGIENTLMDEYIKISPLNKNLKTSVKPKCYEENKLLDNNVANKDLFTTNCLKILANKDIKKYIEDEKIIQEYYNKINTALNDAKEQFWNYNNFIRSTMRSFKENKEYYRRKLGEI